MPHPEDITQRTADAIVERFAVTPDHARRLAIKAMDGIDSHGGDPHDWETIDGVINVVVRAWIAEKLVP